MSKKEIIYIDADDDITAVIDKLVSSKSPIVALVLPKRFAVLQSVVNMKLLKRSADGAKKQPVLITSERSLLPLAGIVGLYVSNNLQTRPAIPETHQKSVIDESIIEDDLKLETIADEGRRVPNNESSEISKEAKENIAISDPDNILEKSPRFGFMKPLIGVLSSVPVIGHFFNEKAVTAKQKKAIAVPNFSKFRNKLLLSGFLLAALVTFGVLAVFILPKATIEIDTKTTRIPSNINFEANTKLVANDFETNKVVAQTKQIKKTISESFRATGEKDVGTNSKGTITFENCYSSLPVTVPSGTIVTDKTIGEDYETQSSVTIDGAQIVIGEGGGGCVQSATADVDVIATQSGDDKNLSPRSYSVAGFESMSAFGSQMSGGTSKVVKVVSPADIEAASDKLLARKDSSVAADLAAQFGSEFFILDESIETTIGEITSEPAVNQEVTDGQVSAQFTYSLTAVPKATIERLLANVQLAEIAESQEEIIDNGYGAIEAKITTKHSANRFGIKIRTSGYSSPVIDGVALAEEVSGKRFSEVVQIIESKPGVRSANVKFSPFWVFNAPQASKITVLIDAPTDDQTVEDQELDE